MPGVGEPIAEVLVGRQPIFDRRDNVVGYELLFRSGPENHASIEDADQATARVVMGSLTEIGLERLVGRHAAWINVTREFILDGLVEAMPGHQTVIEILEDQLIDDELVDAVRELKLRGYRIALDDFVYAPEAEPLLSIVDIVKLDIRALGAEGFLAHVETLRPFGVTLLAEKVETREEHAFCAEAGCDLFQGYFYCKPEIVRDRQIAAGRLALLQFISTLQDPAVEFADLEQHIARDLVLTYRLLRYVNSAFFSLRREVSSITQALVLMGVENLRRWATLSLFASIDDKPQELTVTALVRAHFCELAGAGLTNSTPGELFTLGLFSVIDALLDSPIEEIIRSTPFPDDMCDALIDRRGEKGLLLVCVSELEAGRIEHARALVDGAAEMYLESLMWAGDAAGPLFDHPAPAAA